MSAIAFFVAILSVVAVFSIAGLQLYVRWYINQNYTLLGGSELEVLTVASFGLLFGLVYLHHRENN